MRNSCKYHWFHKTEAPLMLKQCQAKVKCMLGHDDFGKWLKNSLKSRNFKNGLKPFQKW